LINKNYFAKPTDLLADKKKKTYLKKKDNTTKRSAGTTRRKWAQDKYIHCIQTEITEGKNIQMKIIVKELNRPR
jgi:hypothetical protein